MTADAIGVFVALIAVASLVVLVSRGLGVPDEVGLVLVGLLAAFLVPDQTLVTPSLVLLVLLPPLVFEASYRLGFEEFRRALVPVVVLAIPGVLITAVVVAIVLNVTLGMDARLAFVVGAMISPTDPAAMIAAFARLRTPRGLATLVQSESLLNDGTGIVLFAVALAAVNGPLSIADAGLQVALAVVGSTAIGLVLGFVASRLIALVDDFVVEIAVTIGLAYGGYLVADRVGLSGIIATVVAGITLGTYGRRIGMSERTREAVEIFWSVAGFVVTAVVFLLVGMAIRVDALVSASEAIVWASLAIILGRGIVVYLILGIIGRVAAIAGRGGFTQGWLHVIFWAGLRGAVAVALALSLPVDIPQRQLMQEIVFGIVLVTILVQGTTAPLVIARALGATPDEGTI